RPLGVLALAVPGAGALALALAIDRVHVDDLHVEDLLHRDLDLRLVRPRIDQERVLVLLQQAVALLGDHRRDDDVSRVAAHWSASSAEDAAVLAERPATKRSYATLVNTTSSLLSTS